MFVIYMARKPPEGSIRENVRKYGSGALNIDGTRLSNKNQKVPHGANQLKPSPWVDPAYNQHRHSRLHEGFNKQVIWNEKGKYTANVIFIHKNSCTKEICNPGCPVKHLEKSHKGASHYFPILTREDNK